MKWNWNKYPDINHRPVYYYREGVPGRDSYFCCYIFFDGRADIYINGFRGITIFCSNQDDAVHDIEQAFL